jgi:uncharacterized protein YbgA (DUF1722 family)/uncharacterized protein YbbK (DUF523 family)
MDFPRLKIGVSSCLLGHAVRYDGGHKRSDFICDVLTHIADLQPFCPELAIGLGVPRPAIHWLNLNGKVRVVGVNDSTQDYTDKLYQLVAQYHASLAQLDGYIVKSKSPSCGQERVKIHHAAPQTAAHRAGAFTASLMQQFPALPIEDENHLLDLALRENFMTRLFVHARWQHLLKHNLNRETILQFHTRHKFIFLAHNEAAYRRLNRLLVQMPLQINQSFLNHYLLHCMDVFKKPCSTKHHVNVLQHALRYFRKQLNIAEQQELEQLIDDYRSLKSPLSVPIACIQHHLLRRPISYLCDQLYFSNRPHE